MKHHIASVSFGKDSLAMLLCLIDKRYPLDEVIFYDTGMEFDAIYQVRNRMQLILKENGIGYRELFPSSPFLWTMTQKPCVSKQKGHHCGYGWCGGLCRWGTTEKLKALDSYAESKNAVVYVGIAADETARLIKKSKPYKRYPLAEWGMTENQCLEYCREHGWGWLEKTPVEDDYFVHGGYIDLYDILDRVSCWCCSNKNIKELRNIYKYLPDYWCRLRYIQHVIDRPMKGYKKNGDPVGIFQLEARFESEDSL